MTGIFKFFARSIFSAGTLLMLILYIAVRGHSYRYSKKYNKFLFILVFVVYLFAIDPVRDSFLLPLENKYTVINEENLQAADAYILLGGGIYEKAPLSLNEDGISGRTALPRVVETARLYRKYPKKVFIAGGTLDGNIVSEAEIYRKMLVDLGVDEKDIYIDSKSRTTYENGKYIFELVEENGVKKPVLVTSALHMPRSVNTFNNFGVSVFPAPCGYITERNGYSSKSFIPTFQNLEDVRDALWEYMGAFYYKLKFSKKGDKNA